MTEDGGLLAEVRLRTEDGAFLTGLRDWLGVPLHGCTPGAVREATVILAALLANAFQHGKPPYRVGLNAHRRGHVLRISVDDTGAPPGAPWDPRGGLRVVRGLCQRWGVIPAGEGKTVWAELRVIVAPSACARWVTGDENSTVR